MKRLLFLAGIAVLFALQAKTQAITQPFQLWNVNTGRSEPFRSGSEKGKLHLLVFLSPECPLCKNYSLSLNALQKKYADALQITGIVPGRAYSAAEVKEYMDKYRIGFSIYIDSGKSVSGHLKATVTPEVFLVGPGNSVLYHGAIDNWVKDLGMQSAGPTRFYLRDAIDLALAGKPVNLSYIKPVGCLINDY